MKKIFKILLVSLFIYSLNTNAGSIQGLSALQQTEEVTENNNSSSNVDEKGLWDRFVDWLFE